MRSSFNAVPDRGGHAYDSDPAAVVQETSAESPEPQKIVREDVAAGPIQAGEQYYTVATGDRLYKIADAFNVSLYWIIKRNDMSDLPYTGQRLIVPGH